MTKITLDDIEYDSEDFSEDQTSLLKEIQYNGNIKQQLEYQLHSISTVGNGLVDRLKKSLVSETIPDKDASN
jgi:hypothetical protein|tara:strand:- start:2262 stop:2477 length:216 start_codon:yes stop_codon:yes gene_type:complete